MINYILASLPRSGSYLIAQLLERYLLARYPDKYLASPFYEFFCEGTINRTKNLHVDYVDGQLLTSERDKVNFDSEINHRMGVMESLKQDGKMSLFKLMFNVNPAFVNQYFLNNLDYHMVFIYRRNAVDLMLSRLVANNFRSWHNFKQEEARYQPTGTKNSVTDEIPSVPPHRITVREGYVNKQLTVQGRYIHRMENRLARGNSTVLDYDAVIADYSKVYEALGIHDWKDYIKDFDFIVTKPCDENFKRIITNYDEVVSWVTSKGGSYYE